MADDTLQIAGEGAYHADTIREKFGFLAAVMACDREKVSFLMFDNWIMGAVKRLDISMLIPDFILHLVINQCINFVW